MIGPTSGVILTPYILRECIALRLTFSSPRLYSLPCAATTPSSPAGVYVEPPAHGQCYPFFMIRPIAAFNIWYNDTEFNNTVSWDMASYMQHVY